jgi:hypothetical protein
MVSSSRFADRHSRGSLSVVVAMQGVVGPVTAAAAVVGTVMTAAVVGSVMTAAVVGIVTAAAVGTAVVGGDGKTRSPLPSVLCQ